MDGVVEMLNEWIVDDANKGFELMGKGEGDGDVGVSVDEVGGSVYGVDDEGWSGGEAAGRGGFFA